MIERPPMFRQDSAADPEQASSPVAGDLDLASCDREPIHIPGSIQPHGFLLSLDEASRVAVGSSTAASYLGLDLATIFSRSLPELLGEVAAARILSDLALEPLTAATRLLSSVTLHPGSAAPAHFEVIAYQADSLAGPRTTLEFELASEPADVESINSRLYNFIASIRRMSQTAEICQAAVEEILALTRCDRIVLYRFDGEGHGLVLAETLAHEQLASYLGLRFPASDVPAQARRMYLKNRVRIVPDVDYEPSPLLTAQGPAPAMDLSSSILRSVSPIHRQYMRNMGTACSMSISIIIEEQLWGLVSCHHQQPRYVPLRLRSACDFIMQIVASQIESRQHAMRLESALRAKEIQARLLASMAAQESYTDGMARSPSLLLELVSADGVAIVTGSSVACFGVTPSEQQALQLSEWIRETQPELLFASNSLASIYPEATAFCGEASGVLALSVSKIHNTRLLWFRRELVQTVRWAGDPDKPGQSPASGLVPNPGSAAAASASLPGNIMHPRHSFDEWRQTLRGTCEPWTAEELLTAEEFRSAVLEIVLHRAEELASLAAGLQVANEELEAFSYSVSHDLRAPFRHISGFSEMLREEEGDRLSENGRRYLATIMDSARFAGLLVDSLLDFSRFARSKMSLRPVNMEQEVDSEWQAVLYDEGQQRSVDFSRGPLPLVMADPQLLRQVLRNLFSNALKYTSRQRHAVVRMEAQQQGALIVFSLRDNGAGFDQQYAGKLFGIFQRLHRMEDFEGTGIGLANIRRIITRHGGNAWAEGEVGRGATFYFSLPTPGADQPHRAENE